jgi:hypothetical protein
LRVEGLSRAGGGGRTFVRGVKDYVKTYSARPGLVPPEHVLVFDEAQRAFDAEMVRTKHNGEAGSAVHKSEPEHFVEFAERIPGWCVVVGLIGGGQEIHVGEEGGLVQWRWAVEGAKCPAQWMVHAPFAVSDVFEGSPIRFDFEPALNLDTELRFHFAKDLDGFVAGLLEARRASELRPTAERLEVGGFGVRLGPWYGDAEDNYAGRSCRRLGTCVTEFGAQGLELDATLLAWGTDLVFTGDGWSNANARGYLRSARVRNPFQLRLNAYRVLPTRGRDACVVFVPPLPALDSTFDYLSQAGFRRL